MKCSNGIYVAFYTLFSKAVTLFYTRFCRIKTFPKEEILWRELKKLVQSQDLNVNELDVETKFLRGMFNHKEISTCVVNQTHKVFHASDSESK